MSESHPARGVLGLILGGRSYDTTPSLENNNFSIFAIFEPSTLREMQNVKENTVYCPKAFDLQFN